MASSKREFSIHNKVIFHSYVNVYPGIVITDVLPSPGSNMPMVNVKQQHQNIGGTATP